MSDKAIALVTGGSRGIGRAAALALSKAGADVAVNYQRREAGAQAVCQEIGGMGRRALAIKADVSQAAEVARSSDAVVVGSAIVRRIGEHGHAPGLCEMVEAFVTPIAQAVKHPGSEHGSLSA